MRLPGRRPALMGILNVTPDSFSDGGRYMRVEEAIEAGLRMMDEGADIIDVGGESTRPGAEAVSEAEEVRRVLNVVEGLARRGVAVSIDTSKAAVAARCLEAGAAIVNDVTALSDVAMAEVCARAGCTVCLMHMKGNPRTMQQDPRYDDVVQEVREFLLSRAASSGLAPDRIWIDPGIGFGKTKHHNLALLRHLSRLVDGPYPVLVGVSRKSFLGRIASEANPLPPEERLSGTLAAQTLAQHAGVKVIRAHDVLESRRAIDAAAAILAGPDQG